MIGNDVISIAVIRKSPRAGNARFLQKVLSPSEQYWILESPDPERALWTLWALKESTYKLEFKRRPHRFFAPKRYVCKFTGPGITHASIQTPDGLYVGRISQHAECIHAIAGTSQASLNQVIQACVSLPSDDPSGQSIALREALGASLEQKIPHAPLRVSPPGEGSYPRIWYATDQAGPDLSLSHHGNWGAYAYLSPSASDPSGL